MGRALRPKRGTLAWEAQPGPQSLLIRCLVDEVCFGGARGGGKTDGMIGKWLAHEAMFGGLARGIIFRRTYSELEQIEERAEQIFPYLGARYSGKLRRWRFPSGATLKFRHLQYDKSASLYQGHSYTFVGVDEIGNFPSHEPISKLKATLRSAGGAKTQFVCTANPGGPGHNWVKAEYISPAPPLVMQVTKRGKSRVFIPSRLEDNLLLHMNDPEYWVKIADSGIPEYLLKAWLEGDWDIVAGGYFDDLWKKEVHVVKPFEIPRSWYFDRSFDWGSSKPFSVGWWAQSDGTSTKDGVYYPKGTLVRIGEWYGWNGKPNEGLKMTSRDIAKGIKEREKKMGLDGVINPGPADPSIWDCSKGDSIAADMELEGVHFVPAENKPGSRKIRWEKIRQLLKNTTDGNLEAPHIYTFNTCNDGFLRCFPVTQRDINKPDDIDTAQEDHVQDEAGYRVMGERMTIVQSSLKS